MTQEDKETEDWLAVFSGQSVPNANPEMIREAQTLRAELKFRQNPRNPQILKNIFKATGLEPGWRRDVKNIWQKISQLFQSLLTWKLTLPLPVAATVALLLVMIPLVIQPLIISKPESNIIGIPKTLIPVQELMVFNPQAEAEALTVGLAKLGITVTFVKKGAVWEVDVANLSTDNPDALSILLQKHWLKRLPPPMANQLSVHISAK